jgi:hypothetical protein
MIQPPKCSPEIATQRAALMFGCYRRGDASDPDTYVAAVAAVFSSFSEDVVFYVTDPRTGIPGDLKWLPNVAECKEACLRRQGYLDWLADLDSRFAGRSPSCASLPDGKLAGRRANVRVPKSHPGYEALLNWTESADPMDWRIDEDGDLFVPYGRALLLATRVSGPTAHDLHMMSDGFHAKG